MTIVLPIVFFAVVMGFWVRRMTTFHWLGLAAWVALVIAHAYVTSHHV